MPILSSKRNIRLLLAGGLIIGTLILYAIVDPGSSRWMPKCPVHLLTGLDCPGCGSQRALHALLKGNVSEAFNANALLFLMVPFIVLLGIGELFRCKWPRFHRSLFNPAVIYGLLAIVAAWTIFRNIFC